MAEANDALMEGGQATFDKAGEKVVFELEPTSVGLTKEQLEKYRNDPFWKPVRTILFALFWLAWIAMFVAAIAIVVLSPKCAEKQKPTWWQTKASYQLLTATFRDSDGDGVGDFNGITEKMDLLRKLGVTTVYPTPVIKIDKDDYFNPYNVIDHLKVDDRFGTEEDFKKMVDGAHDRDMYVVMDLPLTSISDKHPWFVAEDTTSFVTAGADSAAKNFFAFKNQDLNNTKYLGYPSSSNPVLNWQEPKVKAVVMDAVKKFLLLGVDGFHLDHVSQLALNEDGTTDEKKSIEVLKEITGDIKKFIDSHSDIKDKKIVLFSSLRDIENLHAEAKETGDLHYVIDTSFAQLKNSDCAQGLADCVNEKLNIAEKRDTSDGYVPFWQFSNAESSRLSSRFDEDTADLLTFTQLTLPGALSLYYGQELGLTDIAPTPNVSHGVMQWTPAGDDHHGFTAKSGSGMLFWGETKHAEDKDNFESQYGDEKSNLKVYQKLSKLRQREEALIVGLTSRKQQGDVLVYSRYLDNNGTAGGSAFIAALNFGSSPVSVKLSDFSSVIPAGKDLVKAEIMAVTAGVESLRAREKLDLATNAFDLPAKQGVLVKV